LAGTDLFGAALTTPNPADAAHPFQYLIAITDAHGVFTFSSLKPPSAGTSYTLTEVPPAFLLNGIDSSHGNALVTNAAPLDNQMTMAWGITDQSGDITGLTFAERGVDIGSLQDASGFINDYMSLSGPNGFVVDGSVAGKSAWSFSLPGWENAKTLSVNLDSSLASLTISGVDGQGTAFSVILHQNPNLNVGFPTGSQARFYILGIGAGGQYIIRISGSSADCGLNLLAAAPGSGGEGEAPARQYAESADAVFAEGSWS
jgi:hypothetical protein